MSDVRRFSATYASDRGWVIGRVPLMMGNAQFVLASDYDKQEAELADAVRLLKRVTKELNRFHLNEKKWIGNPFECPICRMIESAENVIKRQEAPRD